MAPIAIAPPTTSWRVGVAGRGRSHPIAANDAGQQPDDRGDDREGGSERALEGRRYEVAPRQARQEPGRGSRERARERGQEDRADRIEIERDLERARDGHPEHDVDRDRDGHEDERARVELPRDRIEPTGLAALHQPVRHDRGWHRDDRDERPRGPRASGPPNVSRSAIATSPTTTRVTAAAATRSQVGRISPVGMRPGRRRAR